MKVCHVISSIDKNSGGTTEYLRLLTSELSENIKNSVRAFNSYQPVKLNKAIDVTLSEKPRINLGCSSLLKEELLKIDCDVFHGNGLWQMPVHCMSKTALKRKIPYIISPHGMLEPWSLNQSRLKKKIALSLFQYNDLEKASCIHATAPMEVENIRELGLRNPIAMIPNGIDLNSFPKEVPVKNTIPKKILFLSRIHPKKGIENLIKAWKLLDKETRSFWEIEIVGNGEKNYIQSLKNEIIREKLSGQINISKPVFGIEKINLFRKASLFVLPTFSENFGIVIAEALASYTPVITTKGAPWEDLEENNCGWWVDIGVETLKAALDEAINKSTYELAEMGSNGRQLIEDKYSMDSVAKQMTELYNWILTKKNKPNFVSIK